MTTGIHIYRCENPTRTRVMCPHHKHLCYGERQEFYDTNLVFLDCGTHINYGYGYYQPPKLYNHITIFKDEGGFTAWAPRAGWEMLVRKTTLEKARRISRMRLKKGGSIIEKI